MNFTDLKLDKSILKALAKAGYTQPTEVQQLSIPIILNGTDLMGCAQTGTGKTAAFAFPIIQQLIPLADAPKKGKKISALILSPTRELALQINDSFKTYSEYTNLRSTVIFGGAAIEPQIDILKKGVDILVATPGRLLDLHKQDYINLDYIKTFVLDEADLMLDMGFIDDVRKIERLCPEHKQTLLFSATMPHKVNDLAKTILKSPKQVNVSPTQTTSTAIEQLLYYVPKRNKIELCLHLLRNTIKGQIIIFRRTKFGVDKLETSLTKNGYSVVSIHGDKSQSNRQTALNQFKSKAVHILVATDVAARGIDIDKLDAVINFDLPNIPETYIHRIGRTGRANHNGKAYTFCSADEKNYVKPIELLLQKAIPINTEHPYPLNPKEKPIVHKKPGSKYKKGRKGQGSKKNKKRWY